ncbi:GAF and ANTAR domain-containing protein [Kribbella sp. NPDC026611]|uniref:GAF and ANTAR domain-containing protein n=1 Tax=Kribbella sp. NPDC026611 TaxID=3154911 RepID=UPI003408DC5A
MTRVDEDQATADAFARLAVEMHAAEGVEETVETVVRFALSALHCSHAGVALYTGSKAGIPAVTDPLMVAIYQFQLDSGTGPLPAVIRSQEAVLVRDTRTENRWPEWAAMVGALGVRSVLDVPLLVGSPSAPTVGVLGLYGLEPDAFDRDDEAIAHILARHASVALAGAREVENLTAAVDARKVVGQAMGILMERYSLDEARAFQVLKRYSQNSGRKLRDVALELIGTRKLPG